MGVKLLLAFSVQHNVPRLVAQSPESSKFMDGIRTLSLFWIVLGHANSYMEQVPLFNPVGFYTQVLSCYPSFRLGFCRSGQVSLFNSYLDLSWPSILFFS